MTNTDTPLFVTRFNTFTRAANEAEGLDEREVVRFFDKRKLVGEFDIDDISRPDWEETLPEFIAKTKAGKPRALPVELTAVMDFLGQEEDDMDDDDASGSIVPEAYRILYGSEQNCGDDIAQVLTDFVTVGRVNKKAPDGGLDRAKLAAVAEINGIGDKLAEWLDRELNGGLLRMNTSNVLRGMVRRGEQVTIGERIWAADPSKLEDRMAKRKAARKAKKAALKVTK